MCSTGQPIEECESCTVANVDDIYVAHYAVCGKPTRCSIMTLPPWDFQRSPQLCRTLSRRWHDVRTYLEIQWNQTAPEVGYQPKETQGHCKKHRKQIKMTYNSFEYGDGDAVVLIVILNGCINFFGTFVEFILFRPLH
jgi:hypothetical protein